MSTLMPIPGARRLAMEFPGLAAASFALAAANGRGVLRPSLSVRSTSRQLIGPHPDFPGCRIFFSNEDAFGWVEPKPSTEVLERFYRSDYRKARRETPTPRYVDFMTRRAEVQRRFIVRHGRRSRLGALLDIGCGAGLLLNGFAQSAQKLVGYETDDIMSAFAASKLGPAATIHRSHFDPAQDPDQPYDLVALSHVFEHIAEPKDFLAGLRRWLAPGGHVFIEVPNDPLPRVRYQVERPVRGLAHVCFFTPDSLRATATSAGFEVAKLATYGTRLRQILHHSEPGPNQKPNLIRRWTTFVRRKCELGPAVATDLTSPLRTETPSDGQHLRALLRLPG